MVAFPIRPRLILPIAPLFAVAATVIVSAAALLTPADLLGSAVVASGLPTIIPAAAPPLGLNARLVLTVAGGSVAAALTWIVAYLAVGARTIAITRPVGKGRFSAPRLEASSDSARAPIIATRDLGTPFLEVTATAPRAVERQVPKDLDLPLAAFDPAALPPVPATPVPVVAPLVKAPGRAPVELDPGERIDTFLLPTPIAAPETEATIHALLERLERGIAERRPAPPKPISRPSSFLSSDTPLRLESMLGELRHLATARQHHA